MYTELRAYQIVIALLKEYKISHCVLSAGSRNVPLVHSIEEDPYFHCYSVVDERSAGYFALGLSQQLNKPVVISCTSSTATCNYWPPVAEAFYQGVPIIIITSDRDPAMLGQWEDQMIDQVGMYDRHVKKSVNLPIISNHDDEIFCQRLVNEALLELNHHGSSPIHINIPMKTYNNSFNVKKLPKATRIERFESGGNDEIAWQNKIDTLINAKRILVICGQSSHVSSKLQEEIKNFFEKYNAVVIVDYMANIDMKEGLNTTVCMDDRYVTNKKMVELLPDIVISFGGNIFSGIKEQLRKFVGVFEHWLIQEDGRVVDLYKSITTIFECKPEYFFKYCRQQAEGRMNDRVYYQQFKKYVNSVKIPNFDWSHVYAIKEVVERVPSGSILHLSINDSIRITNFFKLQPGIKTYANIGTHGIDGCLSSFLGQAAVSDKPSYLVIGDLAFFYDMNAIRLRHIGRNVHILLINNGGGSEFYFNRVWKNQASDLHTTARHHTQAEGWVKSNKFIYLSAHDKDSMRESFNVFMKNDLDSPVLLEVFTEMKHDSDVIHNFFDLSRPRDVQSETIRRSKEFVKATMGQEKAQKIADMLKKR